jgi:TonB-dependent SusC/RagA subfamily outer membrane receptor
MSNSIFQGEKIAITAILIFITINNAFPQNINKDSLRISTLNNNKDIPNSTATINYKDFNQGSIQDPLQLIQGKISGFSVSKAGGNPNKTFEMRLRGLGSLSCPADPLIIIDGMIGASIESIDANDIESIKVIKDGSAAFYGLRGSNGVVIINTKHRVKDRLKIEYNGYTSVETVTKALPSMDINQWKALSKETGFGTDFKNNTVWLKEITNPAMSVVHNLSFSGGTENTFYRASFNYRNVPGILINTELTQLNGRINITQKAFKNRLTLDFNLGATERNSKIGFSEAFRYAAIYNPTSLVRSNDPEYSAYGGYFQQSLYSYYNPVAIEEMNKNEGKDKILNAGAKIKIEILKGLSVDASYSIQKDENITGTHYARNDYFMGQNYNGYASKQLINNSISQVESTLSYVRDINSNSSISFLAGYSYEEFKNDGYLAHGFNYPTDNYSIENITGGTYYNKSDIHKKWGYKAYFGNFNLNINDFLFVFANARYDLLRFVLADNISLFPSAGAGINLSRLLSIKKTDMFKFRISYGTMGNMLSDITLSTPPDLKCEKRVEFDAGIDFAFANSRLSGALDYYSSLSSNLIMHFVTYVPPAYGIDMNLNRSRLTSSGMEMTLKYDLIKKSDLRYTLSFNLSWLFENTIKSLSGLINGTEINTGQLDLGIMGGPGQDMVPLVTLQKGKPVGQIYALIFKGIDSNGRMMFVDVNNDGKIDALDRQVVGNGIPKLNLGFGNSISYKNWDLNLFFRGVFGHDLVNSFRALYDVPYMISSYNLPVTATDMRGPNGKLMIETSGTLSSKDVENASFVSLDNASLGYRFKFSESSLISNLRLYVAGNNLFYITRYKGADPNPRYTDSGLYTGTYNSPLVSGIDRVDSWARTRSATIGVNITF